MIELIKINKIKYVVDWNCWQLSDIPFGKNVFFSYFWNIFVFCCANAKIPQNKLYVWKIYMRAQRKKTVILQVENMAANVTCWKHVKLQFFSNITC